MSFGGKATHHQLQIRCDRPLAVVAITLGFYLCWLLDQCGDELEHARFTVNALELHNLVLRYALEAVHRRDELADGRILSHHVAPCQPPFATPIVEADDVAVEPRIERHDDALCLFE